MSSRIFPLGLVAAVLLMPIAAAQGVGDAGQTWGSYVEPWLVVYAPEEYASVQDGIGTEDVYPVLEDVDAAAPGFGSPFADGPAPEDEEGAGASADEGSSSEHARSGGILSPVVDLLPALPVDVPIVEDLVVPLALPVVPVLPESPVESKPFVPASAVTPAEPEPIVVVLAGDEPAPAEIAAAVVAMTASVGAASTSSWGWSRLRRFALAAALYTRLAKERLLDHGTRERLLAAVREQPGRAVADLAEAAQVPRNTVTYHLRVLERERLVSSQRNGRTRLFFAPGTAQARDNADALAALRHEKSRAMALEIGHSPGVDQKALCEKMGLSPSLVHWHADRLVATGLVDKRREGRFVRYYPGASFALVVGA